MGCAKARCGDRCSLVPSSLAGKFSAAEAVPTVSVSGIPEVCESTARSFSWVGSALEACLEGRLGTFGGDLRLGTVAAFLR